MLKIELSPEQEEAVRCVGKPVLVSAGAGSGKTRTLIAKIAYLVNELNVDPARILAITFTNKAADEMKGRLQQITGFTEEFFPWVRTFHSACFRILKQECEKLGYSRPISVHTESQQKSHLKKILLNLNVDKKYLNAIYHLISRAKNSGNPEKFLSGYKGIPKIEEIYRNYNNALKESNAVDFDDILLLTRNLFLQYPEVRKFYQNMFDYVLVDEFQDSNQLQNEIMELIVRNGNFTVVGDDYQSIYQFRGAEPRFFVDFPSKFPDARIFKLERNYRSTIPIVAAADALIANNKFRIKKKCFSVKEGPPITACSFFDEEDEAEWIADQSLEYHRRYNIPWNQIAVLYRTRFCSLALEKKFRRKRLPYKIVGARSFYESKEVQDINAYLISAVNPRDDLAFERILNTPRRGIGKATIKKIQTFRSPGTSFQDACWKALQANAVSRKVLSELSKLKTILEEIAKSPPDKAIEIVLNEAKYKEYLEAYSENSEDFLNRMGNIEQLIYIASQKLTIEHYLEESALVREDIDEEIQEISGIRLMTFHAAKGLEFKVVFIVGLEEGLLPHWRAITTEDGLNERTEGVEEERRLLYVAMTRASERLHLSWARFRQGHSTETSRFVSEIPEKYLIFKAFT